MFSTNWSLPIWEQQIVMNGLILRRRLLKKKNGQKHWFVLMKVETLHQYHACKRNYKALFERVQNDDKCCSQFYIMYFMYSWVNKHFIICEWGI